MKGRAPWLRAGTDCFIAADATAGQTAWSKRLVGSSVARIAAATRKAFRAQAIRQEIGSFREHAVPMPLKTARAARFAQSEFGSFACAWLRSATAKQALTQSARGREEEAAAPRQQQSNTTARCSFDMHARGKPSTNSLSFRLA